ncbi:hypothetical protein OKS35_14220 [Exiguobacterium sp. N5]|uniref:hypothetical protein n=1 Tax=Exiguobacterium sp. N5 TaxID=2990450 RepID=UPI0021F46CDD|nr:hypothetical protein [Exiguobacterium sp. N5]MCV9901280.1 hypothetical protein [Exiguobacterium sp. N5]
MDERLLDDYAFDGLNPFVRTVFSEPGICATCPLLSECTTSRIHRRVIEHHLWPHYLDEVEDLRHKELVCEIYRRRKEMT